LEQFSNSIKHTEELKKFQDLQTLLLKSLNSSHVQQCGRCRI